MCHRIILQCNKAKETATGVAGFGLVCVKLGVLMAWPGLYCWGVSVVGGYILLQLLQGKQPSLEEVSTLWDKWTVRGRRAVCATV